MSNIILADVAEFFTTLYRIYRYVLFSLLVQYIEKMSAMSATNNQNGCFL